LPLLQKVDLVVTDPPYGIGYEYLGYEDTRENLEKLISGFVPEARKSDRVAIFCGVNNLQSYPVADWTLAWYWQGTNTYGKYGINQWQPILCYGKDLSGFGSINGVLKSDAFKYEGGTCDGEVKNFKNHPCPKNKGVIKRVVLRLSNQGQTCIDPFLGSGTTLMVCKELGRKGIGIEINPKYCEIAKKRLQNTQKMFI
jgi:DNA modification methylase